MPSREKKARAGVQAAVSPPAGRPAETVLAPPTPAGSQQTQPAPSVSRRALKNWRVRSRLLLLIIIPTLTAVVLGSTYIVTSVQNEVSYQRVEQLANLSSAITTLAGKLEDERDATVQYIAGQFAPNEPTYKSRNDYGAANQPAVQLVTGPQELTNPWIATLRHEIAGVESGYPAAVENQAQNVTALLADVGALRYSAMHTQLPALDVVAKYTTLIDSLLAIDDDIALGSSDQALATDVRSLGLISRSIEEASEQRALLVYAYTQGSFAPVVLPSLTAAQAEENANIAQFDVEATPQQLAQYDNTVVGSLVDNANQYLSQAIAFGSVSKKLVTTPPTADDVFGAYENGPIGGMRKVEQGLVSATIGRATALRSHAILTAAAVGAAVLIVLLLALLLTTVIGRSMVRPLRRLRSGALEVAGVRLPETVRRMSDTDGTAVPLEVEPIDVDSADEIGEVARAFDQVHREALRLAANEAALRGNVNAMFVNLSRRSQSLVERQIRLIDDLEQGEQDADRLSSLFQMDHLATRMRRNSENLLVLAGHDATRRWNQPVALVDVLRAAVSEIEQYERVTLNVQPGIAVRGHAVNDVVHLLAELAENATSFSSAETPVVVAGHLLSSGGVLLDITDQGVGMGAEEMAHANWRLDNPPVVDVAVSRRMGLFVVARLAARHGIRVRLRPAAAGGLTALVWLPDEVISHSTDTGSGYRRFDQASSPAMSMAVPGTVEDVVSATELEINAARAPKFASLQAESEGNGKLGPRRVPGAGPRPGAVAGGATSTGPLPAFRSSPQSAQPDGDPVSVAGTSADLTPAPAYPPADAFGTSPLPAIDGDGPPPAPASDVPVPVVTGASRSSNGFGRDHLGARGDVVVPAAEHVATENRLPIFEAVESDWFRRGRSGLGGWPGPQESGGTQEMAPVPEVAWTTPSDQGWEAAAAVSAPSTGGTTSAGLPKRVPQANLVPGTAQPEPILPAPTRSASVTRDRFTSFQRGSREGRAAAGSDADGPDQEDSSR